MSEMDERAEDALNEIIAKETTAGAKVVEIYSKPNCLFCVRAKHFLENHGGFTIAEIDAVSTRETLIERVTNATGAPPKTVPQIFIEGEYIGGYDDLIARYGKD